MAQSNAHYKKLASAAYIVGAVVVIAATLIGDFGPITTTVAASLSVASISYGDTHLTGDPLFRWMQTTDPVTRQGNLLILAMSILVWMKVFH